MKKTFIFFMIVCGITFAQNKLFTLEESLLTGLKNSKLLQITESRVTGASANYNEISSKNLPRLGLSASYMRLSDVRPFEVTIPGAPAPVKIQDAILNNYSLKLTLTQPIFTGNRISSMQNAAKNISESVKLENENEANIVSMNIHRAFWNYYKSKKIVGLLKLRLASIENHLQNTKLFLNTGLATNNDLLKLEVLHSDTELKLIEAENNRLLARTIFNRELGINLSEETDIKVGEKLREFAEENFNTLLAEAMENRLELKSLQYKIYAAGENIDAVSSEWYPTISAFASFNYDNPNQRLMPLEDKFYDTWSAGISLHWELWNWGETSAKSEQAKAKLFQTETQKEILKEGIETELYRSYLKFISSRQKLLVSNKQVEQAAENLRILKTKYEQQLSTATDIADAEVSLLEAETNKIMAQADLNIASAELQKAAGRKIY